MSTNETFESLKEILQPYASNLKVIDNKDDKYYLNTLPDKNGKEHFFGSVQIKKNYVAFHLMPLYCNPSLLEGISEDLKKRMQGKSCFNFRKTDETLFQELRSLTSSSFDDFKKQELI
jgi:hypothetical protein